MVVMHWRVDHGARRFNNRLWANLAWMANTASGVAAVSQLANGTGRQQGGSKQERKCCCA
jgi:hypothetical protein